MKFKQLVVAGLILSIASFAKAAPSSEFVVKDIRIEGLQRVALGAALTYLPVTVGDEMNSFRISQLIRSMYSSSHFENIKIFRDGNTLLVHERLLEYEREAGEADDKVVGLIEHAAARPPAAAPATLTPGRRWRGARSR